MGKNKSEGATGPVCWAKNLVCKECGRFGVSAPRIKCMNEFVPFPLSHEYYNKLN